MAKRVVLGRRYTGFCSAARTARRKLHAVWPIDVPELAFRDIVRRTTKKRYGTFLPLARELGRPAHSLIALDRRNDPFHIGATCQLNATWFAEHYRRLQIPSGSHERRCHCRFVSDAQPIMRGFAGVAAITLVWNGAYRSERCV